MANGPEIKQNSLHIGLKKRNQFRKDVLPKHIVKHNDFYMGFALRSPNNKEGSFIATDPHLTLHLNVIFM